MTPCVDHGRYGYNGGYARIKTPGGYEYLHRLTLEGKLGRTLRANELCRHTCDNRRCINPEHLVPGTKADNNADMRKRLRSNAGSDRPSAKLTEAQVLELRTTYIKGHREFGLTAQARRLGVSASTASLALNCHTWRRV